MKCFLIGRQEINFDNVRGFKLFLKGDAPHVDGYIVNDLWIDASSHLYSKVSRLTFVDDKNHKSEIPVELVYDIYLGSKKPVLIDIKFL